MCEKKRSRRSTYEHFKSDYATLCREVLTKLFSAKYDMSRLDKKDCCVLRWHCLKTFYHDTDKRNSCADHKTALKSAICDIPGFKDSIFVELHHSEFNEFQLEEADQADT